MRRLIAALLIPVLVGCSALAPREGTLIVRSDVEGATVKINGIEAGRTPLTTRLRRGKKYMVTVEDGQHLTAGHVGRRISTVGIVDIVGGAIFLLPFLGLAAPGAWEFDPDVLYLPLKGTPP